MLLKLITLAVAAFTLWAGLRKVMGATQGRAPAPTRERPAADMVRCPECGTWAAAEEACPCRTRPIP
jgi:hypothetical protein